MIVKVNRTELLKRFRIVEKAINENKAKIRQILACVYLEAKENELFFCATNLELTIMTSMECEVIEAGKMTFQHQLVDEYLKEISDQDIILNAQGNSLIIETSDSSSEFGLMDPEDFPKLPREEEGSGKIEEKIGLSSVKLLNAFDRVKFAASTSTDNLAINCIRLEVENNEMNIAATDSYRMVYLKEEAEAEKPFSVSIPLSSVDAITKLLKTQEEKDVEIYLKDNQVYLSIGETLVMSRIIDLSFPNYKMILSGASYNKKMEISKEEMEKLLRRVSVFVKNNGDSKFGALFSIGEGELTVNGRGELGKVVENASVDYTGEPIRISLNVKFLLDFLQNLPKDSSIKVDLNSSNSSVRILEADNENYLYIVMPMAIKE